ncbi:hypothetical protein D3C81_1988840 [compost metagenome]
MGAVNLLQEHDVGRHATHRFAQFGQDEAPVQGGEALVGVDRQDGEAAYRGNGVWLIIRYAELLGTIHGSTPSAAGSPGAVARFVSRCKRCRRLRASKGARTLMSLSK